MRSGCVENDRSLGESFANIVYRQTEGLCGGQRSFSQESIMDSVPESCMGSSSSQSAKGLKSKNSQLGITRNVAKARLMSS